MAADITDSEIMGMGNRQNKMGMFPCERESPIMSGGKENFHAASHEKNKS